MTGASGRGKQLAAAIGVTVQGPMQSLAGLARRLERAGVDSVWTGDYFQSGLVRAGVLGAATSAALVGTHVLQAFARSPLATALAAQDLQELTAGRFVLGLGSQFPVANRRWHGVTVERPVAALREYVAAVRALLAAPGDESVRFDGEQFALPRAAVPRHDGAAGAAGVDLDAAAGPATVRLAADVADGLAGHLLWTYSHVRDEVRPVHPGARASAHGAAAGRQPGGPGRARRPVASASRRRRPGAGDGARAGARRLAHGRGAGWPRRGLARRRRGREETLLGDAL